MFLFNYIIDLKHDLFTFIIIFQIHESLFLKFEERNIYYLLYALLFI